MISIEIDREEARQENNPIQIGKTHMSNGTKFEACNLKQSLKLVTLEQSLKPIEAYSLSGHTSILYDL